MRVTHRGRLRRLVGYLTQHHDIPVLDLRHTKGTHLADEGEDVVVIQRTLGHARSRTTADLYIGRVPNALRRAADRYGDLFAPPDMGPSRPMWPLREPHCSQRC